MRELRRALARWRDAPATLTFRTERQRPGLPLSAHQCLRGFVDDRADIPEALQVCDPAGVATRVWDPSPARFRLDVTEAGTTITAIVVGGRGVMCTPELGCRSRTPRWIVRSFPFHELIEPVEVTLAGAGIDPAAPVTGSRRRAGYGALDCFEVASLGSSVVWCFRDGVLRSLRIRPEEEILTTKHEYGAVLRTLEFIRANLVLVEPEELMASIGIRTRAVFVSHVTSPTALVLPVAQVCAAARRAGVLSIVDGAHAPGHLPLDLASMGADVYAGNCHKWLCAPKGSGFLWARPEHQGWIEPLVISWGYYDDAGFGERHGWQGTRDPSAYLSVPAAIAAHGGFDLSGMRDLADEAERRLAPFGLRPLRGERAGGRAPGQAAPMPGGQPGPEVRRAQVQ